MRLESFGRVSACSQAVLPPPGCRPPRAGPAGRARCPAHRTRSVTTCRRATRPPRPLRRPRAPLPHGATWLAREHDCLELILPRGPVPSIRGDCHRPDPFGVSTEKAGGKHDMSLLAKRRGSLLTLPLCTGQTPGARRASPRGGQPDRRCEAPREAGDAAGSARLLPARPKPLRGGRRVTRASAGPCPRPRPVSPRPPRTQVATMADSHTTLTCAPRPRLTPATAPESVEVSGVILSLTGERGQGRPHHGHSHGHGHRHLRPICPGHPGSPASCPRFPGHALHRHAHHWREHRGSALLPGPSRQPQEEALEPSLYRWGGEAPAQCGAARGGPVGPRPAPPPTSRQHARL